MLRVFWGKVRKIIKIESVIPHLHGEDGLSFFFTTQLADAECGVDVIIALHHKMMLQKLCYARKITVWVTFMTDEWWFDLKDFLYHHQFTVFDNIFKLAFDALLLYNHCRSLNLSGTIVIKIQWQKLASILFRVTW